MPHEFIDHTASGRLRHQHEKILEFVREQRGEILQLASGVREAAALADATRRLIATLHTVHHPSEMHDQMREIYNEIWYCGERGDHDTQRHHAGLGGAPRLELAPLAHQGIPLPGRMLRRRNRGTNQRRVNILGVCCMKE